MDAILASALALGALGVFVLMIAESAGLPFPSEAILILAGIAVHQGHMALWIAILAATAGNVTGSLALYALGRRLRTSRLPPRLRNGAARCDRLFARHGDSAVFLARLIPLARSFVSLPAGVAHMPLKRFIPLTIAGCALWAGAFVTVGAVGAQSAVRDGGFGAPSAAPAATNSCRYQGLVPTHQNLPKIRHATRCLINRERRRRGRPILRRSGQLRAAGQRHAEAMVRQRFFAHVSPGGGTPRSASSAPTTHAPRAPPGSPRTSRGAPSTSPRHATQSPPGCAHPATGAMCCPSTCATSASA